MRRNPWLVWMPLVLLPLAACHVDPTYDGTPVSCASDADCAGLTGGPFACDATAGMCVRTGPGGSDGGAGDGGGVDGGSACTPACSAGASCVDGTCAADATLEVTVTAPAAEAVVGDAPQIAASVDGAAGDASITCGAEGGAVADGSGQGTSFSCTPDLTGLPEGEVTVTVTVKDALGRSAETQITIVHDATAPVVTLTGPDWLLSENPDYVNVVDGKVWLRHPLDLLLAATAQDPNLTRFELSLTGPGLQRPQTCPHTAGPTNACDLTVTAPLDPTTWPSGEYVFAAEAEDAAGNVERVQAVFDLSGDGPTVSIETQPDAVVRRDRSATYALRVSSPYHDVHRVDLLVPAGRRDGQPLVIEATPAADDPSLFLATVPARGAAGAPWLPAVEKTFTGITAQSGDAWGRVGTAPAADLTITRTPWAPRILADGAGAAAVNVLSPAVASDGTVYVVGQLRSEYRIFAFDGEGGQKVLDAVVPLAEAGPVILDAQGTRHLYLRGRTPASALYSLDAEGQQEWSLFGDGQTSLVGLPAVAGGELFAPTFTAGATTDFPACLHRLTTAGTEEASVCVEQVWSDAGTVVAWNGGQPLGVVSDAAGPLAKFVFGPTSGASGVLYEVPRIGEPAGWSSASTGTQDGRRAVFLGRDPVLSVNDPGLLQLPLPLASSLGSAWSFPVADMSMGAVNDGTFAVTGGKGVVHRIAIDDPASSGEGALLSNESPLGASIGSDGRVFVYTTDGVTDRIRAFDAAALAAAGASPLWTFEVPAAARAASGTPQTAVLGPRGFLFFPGPGGTLQALITDSPAPAPGWPNVRGDPARTSAIP